MPAQILFGASVAFGFIAWTIVAVQYMRRESRVSLQGLD
jgi:hypothetical protein